MKQKFHRGGYVAGGAFKQKKHPGSPRQYRRIVCCGAFFIVNLVQNSKKASSLRCQPCGNGFLQRSLLMRKCITYTYNGSIPLINGAVKYMITRLPQWCKSSGLDALHWLDCEVAAW